MEKARLIVAMVNEHPYSVHTRNGELAYRDSRLGVL
jgi:hypothetical protein